MQLYAVVLLIEAAWSIAGAPLPPPLTTLDGNNFQPNPVERDLPVITNFWGSVGTAMDMLGLSQILVPPFYDSGIPTGSISINGTHVPLGQFQWRPSGISRWNSDPQNALHTETRMLFEGNGVLQKIDLNLAKPSSLQVTLAAAMLQSHDIYWTMPQPFNMKGFRVNLTHVGPSFAPALLSCHTSSNTCAVWVVLSDRAANWTDFTHPDYMGATASFPEITVANISLALVFGSSADQAMQAATALASHAAFAAAWDGYAEGWAARWSDAFTPKPAAAPGSSDSGHYSGSAPVLTLEGEHADALARIYYMSVFTILAHERTNLPALAPRVYLTGTGNSFQQYSIGGTVQFAWDQSFYGTLMSLLDPAAVKADLLSWIGRPINSTFGIELDNMKPAGYFYAFNAISLYRSFSAYMRVTNDTDFLAQAQDYLAVMVDFWRPYAHDNSTLADYCASPNCYLECVPTYVHATAGLQASNTFMARDYADLLEAQGNQTAATELRRVASTIAEETIARMYVTATSSAGNTAPDPAPHSAGDVGGWWQVVDTRTGNATEVRHVVDFVYTALGFCSRGRRTPGGQAWPCALSPAQTAQMADFALRQLIVPSQQWLRALSPNDTLHYVDRPDHGTTGSYPAWPAMAFDALALLSQDFAGSLQFLASTSAVTAEGPYGQALKIAADGATAFKTSQGWTRYLANNGGAFAESILSMVFGFQPTWLDSNLPSPALQGLGRGLGGTLACVRAPGPVAQYATARLTDTGVVYSWSAQC